MDAFILLSTNSWTHPLNAAPIDGCIDEIGQEFMDAVNIDAVDAGAAIP
jgi:hypothetical protein